MTHPVKEITAEVAPILEQLRGICLAFPEATEKIAWGEPTFRVREKMFAMFDNNHHETGRLGVWCKAAAGAQEILVDADPERFFVPPYMGPKGWIGVRLDNDPEWGMVAAMMGEAYRLIAPKRLAREMEREHG